MSETLLIAEHLSKTFERVPRRFSPGRGAPAPRLRPALLDVSIGLGRGQILGIVGESGSGKSTLARCLTLLERPDSGRVLFDGRDLTRLHGDELREVRRRIQIVFQDPYSSLNPRFTVASQIGEVLRVHRLVPPSEVRGRTVALLDQVGLSASALDRYPSDFSGGQRQRICVARALAAEPSVLIADEAVSALDVSIQAQILNLLLDLQEHLSLAMIFISHNLHVVRHVAPQIAVMFGGRIVEHLSGETSLEQARHPYTQALVTAIPKLERWNGDSSPERAADLAAALPTIGCPYRERCQHAFTPCETIDPVLLPTDGSHLVACHFVTPDSGGGTAREATGATAEGGARSRPAGETTKETAGRNS